MSGRVNILGNNNGGVFNLYDKIPVQSNSSSYRGAMTGGWENSLLSNLFFSAENIRIVQNGLKAGVYKASNGNFRIGDQNEDTLKIIMRSIFLQNAKNNNSNITQQIQNLNDLVLEYAVPQVYGEAEGYLKYKHDISTLATPLMPPVSTYHSNLLELKKLF